MAAVLFVEDEGLLVEAALAGHQILAPSLLPYELANVAWKKIRRQPADEPLILAALANLTESAIDYFDVPAVEATKLALLTGLTAYDASFLWLARELGAPLTTLDHRLQRAYDALA